MNLAVFKKILPLSFVIILSYVIHKLLFFGLKISTTHFIYSLEELYFYFTLFTLFVVFVLLLVKKKNFDNVGMSFLLITTAKMLLCFLIVRPILKEITSQNTIEQFNFFGLFIYFLAIETFFAIHLVNKK